MTRYLDRVCRAAVSLFAACGGNGGTSQPPDGTPESPDASVMPDAPVSSPLPKLALCRVANPRDPSSAFVAQRGQDFVSYTCAQSCPDVATCAVGLADAQGPVLSARGGQLQVLAFVVDGMAGHFVYTPDGDDVLVTHGGNGGAGLYHVEFDSAVQTRSSIKTVSLGWEPGVGLFGSGAGGGSGWFTRKDAAPTTIAALAVRPAAALQFIADTLAHGKRLGTVGASLGAVATFGAHVWWGLDPIIDYQMLIGGPAVWDVNMGCGRDHTSAGHCDVDVAPCTGNPNSSYGNDDPTCGSPTNNCRVPTIMAELPDGSSEFNNAINYVIAGTACAPSDTRDPTLDASSFATTVTSWTFRGPIDFVTQEGAPQPPQSDQGMGEGQAMYVYESIQSAKQWIDDDGHHHGDAWQKDPALVATTAMIVVGRMGH
jgi:hypothetical protein